MALSHLSSRVVGVSAWEKNSPARTSTLPWLAVCLLLSLPLQAFQGMAVPNRPSRPATRIRTNLAPIKVDFRDVAIKASLMAVNVSGGTEFTGRARTNAHPTKTQADGHSGGHGEMPRLRTVSGTLVRRLKTDPSLGNRRNSGNRAGG